MQVGSYLCRMYLLTRMKYRLYCILSSTYFGSLVNPINLLSILVSIVFLGIGNFSHSHIAHIPSAWRDAESLCVSRIRVCGTQ